MGSFRRPDYIPSKARLEELERRFPHDNYTKEQKVKFYTMLDRIFDLDDPAMQ